MNNHSARNLIRTLGFLVLLFPIVINAQTAQASDKRSQISSNVMLSCRGFPCPQDLQPSNFSVSFNKDSQTINNFSDPSVPLSIMIVFDLTSSMKNHGLYRKPEILKESFGTFFNELRQSNEYSLLIFGKEIQTLQEWTSNAKTIWQSLDKISSIDTDGNMEVTDVCLKAVDSLEKRKNEKRVLLLITDTDQISQSSKDEKYLLERIQASQVVLISIYLNNVKGKFYNGITGNLAAESKLERLSRFSGGLIWNIFNIENFTRSIVCIAANLNCFYRIGFETSAKIQAGKTYPLKLSVKSPSNANQKADMLKWNYRESYIGRSSP